MKKNTVFIAKSLDGYISDKTGGLEWLHTIPNPEKIDMGYADFIKDIDAIVMGRVTFETVCGFDIDWPYTVPVFVMSNTLKTVEEKYTNKVALLRGPVESILDKIHQKGYYRLYIDGGLTIHGFLEKDLIDEMIITTIPVLLGGGSKLYYDLPNAIEFTHIRTRVFLDQIVQSHYIRKIQINPSI